LRSGQQQVLCINQLNNWKICHKIILFIIIHLKFLFFSCFVWFECNSRCLIFWLLVFLCLLDSRLVIDFSDYLFITFRSVVHFSGFCRLFCVLLNFRSIVDLNGFQIVLLKFVYNQTINTRPLLKTCGALGYSYPTGLSKCWRTLWQQPKNVTISTMTAKCVTASLITWIRGTVFDIHWNY